MIAPNKALGQHFLVNDGVVSRIADRVVSLADSLGPETPIIEIGPGPGVLTKAILERGRKLVAVEVDKRMVEHLTTEHAKEIGDGRFRVISRDVLRLDLSQEPEFSRDHVVCGNLPYNIGTEIVFRFLEDSPHSKKFCFMLQKEVVQKLMGEADGDHYGPPSVRMAWATDMHDAFWVKPGSFKPPPRVDSGVISYTRLAPEKALANPLERKKIYDEAGRWMAKLFQVRRKMLRATIPELKTDPRGQLRVETLTPKQLLDLYFEINPRP